MDPNANLEELRTLAAKLLAQYDAGDSVVNDPEDSGIVDPHDAARLAELIQAIDQWLTKGSALPEAWRNTPYDPDQVAQEVAAAVEARLVPLIGRTAAAGAEHVPPVDWADVLRTIRSLPLVEAFSDPDAPIQGSDAVDALGEIRDLLDAALGTPPRPAG